MRIDLDRWEEIFITITRNKTRSLLTAFGVFWGIFMLVALMGGGQGLQDMMSANFKGFATNSVFFGSNKTSEAYINPEKPDVPLNKNDAFQKVQKRRVQEKR